MTKIVDYDFNNYIDTIALKEQIFFNDGGRKIDKYCFYKNRKETGLELSYKNDAFNWKINKIASQSRARTGTIYTPHGKI